MVPRRPRPGDPDLRGRRAVSGGDTTAVRRPRTRLDRLVEHPQEPGTGRADLRGARPRRPGATAAGRLRQVPAVRGAGSRPPSLERRGRGCRTGRRRRRHQLDSGRPLEPGQVRAEAVAVHGGGPAGDREPGRRASGDRPRRRDRIPGIDRRRVAGRRPRAVRGRRPQASDRRGGPPSFRVRVRHPRRRPLLDRSARPWPDRTGLRPVRRPHALPTTCRTQAASFGERSGGGGGAE